MTRRLGRCEPDRSATQSRSCLPSCAGVGDNAGEPIHSGIRRRSVDALAALRWLVSRGSGDIYSAEMSPLRGLDIFDGDSYPSAHALGSG